MSKVNLTIAALLITTFTATGFSTELIGFSRILSTNEAEARETPPKVNSQISSLNDVVILFGKQPRKGGGREVICTIAPLPPAFAINSPNVFVSDRPTFIWQGAANRIEVRQAEDEKLIWGKDLKPQESVATYPISGQALLPNQKYELRLLTSNDETKIVFQVASLDQRQRIQAGLQDQVKQLAAAQRTPAAIAVKQAIYLGEQKLWADAFGKVFSVKQSEIPKNEQAGWSRSLTEIRSSVCGS